MKELFKALIPATTDNCGCIEREEREDRGPASYKVLDRSGCRHARQKAEIEQLQQTMDRIDPAGLVQIIDRQQSEIGRLRDEVAVQAMRIFRLNETVAQSHPRGTVDAQAKEIARLTPRPVVAAVIRSTETGNYVIGQRKPGQWMAGKWCFVGGKVESGETPEQAVVREVKEEIGIDVTVGALIHEQIERYEHGTFALHYFACEMDLGQVPQLLECSNVASVSADRLPAYDLLPVDIDIAKRLAADFEIERLRAEVAGLKTNRDSPGNGLWKLKYSTLASAGPMGWILTDPEGHQHMNDIERKINEAFGDSACTIEWLKREIARLSVENNVYQKICAERSDDNDRLRAEVANEKDRAERIKAALSDAAPRLKDATAHIADLTRQLQEAKEHHHVAFGLACKAQDKVAALLTAQEDLRSENAALVKALGMTLKDLLNHGLINEGEMQQALTSVRKGEPQ